MADAISALPTRRLRFNTVKSAGLIWFACVVGVLPSCSDSVTPPDLPDTAYIDVVSGNLQWGHEGQQLANPIVVLIQGEDGMPLQGVQVHFEIISGGGTLDETPAYADGTGLAAVHWTLGGRFHPILKISISDPDLWAEVAYVHANTEIEIETEWVSDIPFPRLFGRAVAHDERILESNSFLLFSDEGPDDMKIGFARLAEETFQEVLQAFEFGSSVELGIAAANERSKVTVFYNSFTDFPYGAFAFNTGYVMRTLDADNFLQVPAWRIEDYRRTMKHETVHLFQFLMGLDNLPRLWPDVWFSEGLAVLLSENIPVIESVSRLDEWLAVEGNENPVTVHDWPDLPIPERQGGRYYTAFGLAVRYLLHEDGHARTLADVRRMFEHMASSRNGFGEAFGLHMGMSLQEYEDNFFDLVTGFLSRQNDGSYAMSGGGGGPP